MSNDIHLWHVALDRPPDEADHLAASLSDDELARAARFRDPRLGRRFAVGRAALRHILARLLDVRPSDSRFSYTGAGKPELANRGINGPHFNVTHSAGVAVIGVSWSLPIGVDIERLRPEFAAEEIAHRFFSPRECACLRSVPPEQRVPAFFRCWTRKEAVIKALGAGLWFPLNEFDVSLAPDASPSLLALRGDETAAQHWSLREIDVPPGYVAALAVEGPIRQVIVEEPII